MSAPPKLSARACGPVPLVLGITGHRDLRPGDVPALEAGVEAIFRDLAAKYATTPLVLLSPLAEGADRLAARVALRCGVRLVCPLPMPKEEYLKDFESDASRSEFEELLAKADRWYELPMLDGNDLANIAGQNNHRAHQYGLVGAFIVRECQLLIALWNGVDNEDIGGTSQVVRFQLGGIDDDYRRILFEADGAPRNWLDPVEGGPVVGLVTPRANHPGLVGEALARFTRRPKDEHGKEQSEREVALVFRNIDEYNREALRVEADPQLKKDRDRNAGWLLPDAETACLGPVLRTLRDSYATADTLAQHYQTGTLSTLKTLCWAVFLAVLSFELSAKLAPHSGPAALVFPVLLALTWVYWATTVRRGRWQDRHQDYRALAEGLRVEFFWRVAGLPTSVADHYLRKQKGELDWIRIAVRNLSDPTEEFGVEREPRWRLETVQEHWVKNQAKYFARAAHREEHTFEKYEKWISLLVAASPIVAFLTAMAMVIPSPVADYLHHHEKAHKILVILVFVLAGIGGVLHTYVDKRAMSQHAKQYDRMGMLFGLAARRFQEALDRGSEDDARQILLELGKESLAENGDWVLTHRERPVDVPHAG